MNPGSRAQGPPEWLDLVVRGTASGLFLSHLPARLAGEGRWTGAGLVGTLWGLALLPWVPQTPGRFAFFYALALVWAVLVCGAAELSYGRKDEPRIVLDETVGFWAAAAFLPRTWTALAAAFVLFRILDASKPWPLSRLERLGGGLGIVLDDVAAGAAANLIIRACLLTF